MKTRIVPFGNSQIIRIPKRLLDLTGLAGEVDITADGDTLVIRSVNSPRAGWSEAFREMANHGGDALLDDVPPQSNRWDEDEWQWK